MSRADVCLLLEGSYPFVRGGVSSWVQQLIVGLPEIRFHIVYIGSTPESHGEPCYLFPENVVGFECHYIHAPCLDFSPTVRAGGMAIRQLWSDFLRCFRNPETELLAQAFMQDLLVRLSDQDAKLLRDFLYSKASWAQLSDYYLDQAEGEPFIDFFWTYRQIFRPLITLLTIATRLPKAGLYHSISTGYAGFLGALCQSRNGVPLLLTEHGIYTKERKIDLAKLYRVDHDEVAWNQAGEPWALKAWCQFFEQLGRAAYITAEKTITLFEGNRQRQIADGAVPERTRVIVNGINLRVFSDVYSRRPAVPPAVIGLIGRVVPIKDVKTFIRTIRAALELVPDLEGWIIGPTEEDHAYAEECRRLIESLGLQDRVRMLGNQDVTTVLPRLGAVMLTSISEAQPLVLLESMAAGIPCIATDVGSCREIIEGRPGADAKLGRAGRVINIACPGAGAEAILSLLSDAETWRRTGDIGRERICSYYDEEKMFHDYRALYRESLAWQE